VLTILLKSESKEVKSLSIALMHDAKPVLNSTETLKQVRDWVVSAAHGSAEFIAVNIDIARDTKLSAFPHLLQTLLNFYFVSLVLFFFLPLRLVLAVL
jgi:hypothetical protein